MKRTKTTEIIVERDEFYVVRHSAAPVTLWCETCGAESQFAYPVTAALLTLIPARTLFRQAEAGLIHFTETPEGLLLFCLTSLR